MRKKNDTLWRVKNDERMIGNKTIGSGLGLDITMQMAEEDREGRVEDKARVYVYHKEGFIW